MDEEEIAVPGQGFGVASAIVFSWLVILALVGGSEMPWAGPVALSTAPVAALLVLWAFLARRVIVVSSDGVLLTRRPIALWEDFIPREQLRVVSIDEDLDPERGHARWAVVALTARGTVTLAEGYTSAEAAQRVAERIRQVVRC